MTTEVQMTLCLKILGMSQVTTQVSETKISDALVTGHTASELLEMVQYLRTELDKMWSGVPRLGHKNTPSFQSVSSVMTDASTNSTESNVDEFNLGPKYMLNVEGQLKSVLL